MTIAQHLQNIQQQIHHAEQQYQRPHGCVTLLAVSKQQTIANIRAAISAGQRCFGENYVQEALTKIAALEEFSLEWHFIGKLQSNKTQAVAQHFSWVHSIDRLRIAERLNQQRPLHLPKLNVCIELNISQQRSKSGVALQQLAELAHAVNQLENLRLRGLMAIPEPSDDFKQQLVVYRQVAAAQKELCAQGLVLDTLSMGMSQDFVAAIAAGSTMVRIGTAVFGGRG